MEAVFDWVKSVVFYLLLLTIVSHLIPGKKYDKYIRLFTGMLLVMIVIKPITQIFSWNDLFDKSFLRILEDSVEFEWEDEAMAEEFKDVQEQQLIKEYERQVKAYVQARAEALGIRVTRVEVEAARQDDVIVPDRISMTASASGSGKQLDKITVADIIIEEQKKEDTQELSSFQKELAEYYGIAKEQIRISGR